MDKAKKTVTFVGKNVKQKSVKKSKSKLALEKLKNKNDELKKAVEMYEKQDVQKDISFLKTTVNNKEFEIQQLEEQLQAISKGSEQNVVQVKESFYGIEKSLNDRLNELEKDNEALTFQAKSVEELKLKNLNLLQELSKIEYNMKLNDEEWENKLVESQRQAVRDRLQVKTTLTAKLDEIAKNYKMNINDRLTKEIQTILQENKTLKQQIKDMEDDFVALQKTSHDNKEKLHNLSLELTELRKLQVQKTTLDVKLGEAESKLRDLEIVNNDRENLQQKCERLEESLSNKEDQINKLTYDLQMETEENKQLNGKITILDEMVKNQISKENEIKAEAENILTILNKVTRKFGGDTFNKENECEFCEIRLTLYEGIAKLCNYLHIL